MVFKIIFILTQKNFTWFFSSIFTHFTFYLLLCLSHYLSVFTIYTSFYSSLSLTLTHHSHWIHFLTPYSSQHTILPFYLSYFLFSLTFYPDHQYTSLLRPKLRMLDLNLTLLWPVPSYAHLTFLPHRLSTSCTRRRR